MESLLALRSVEDFRALARITRSLCVTVELRLIDIIPGALDKIITFSRVERLRSAKKIVAFNEQHPDRKSDSSIHALFITNNAEQIDSERRAVWPGCDNVEHSSQ